MNKRQIPFLHWEVNRDGTVTARWKPSPRLRELGWPTRKLGTCDALDAAARDALTEAGMAVNRELAEWETTRTALAPNPLAPRPPKVWTLADLIAAYKASPAWTHELEAVTRRHYTTRLNQLDAWARDAHGRSIPLVQLDRQMVVDLKDTLLPVSTFKCAATLKVLRLLLNWAKARPAIGLTHNATEGVAIPATAARQARLTWDETQAVAAAAESLGYPVAARAFRIAFWSLQREGDLIALAKLQWRPLEGMDALDRAALADSKGEVRGFPLRQAKTKAWVCAPMPPELHAEIDAAFEESQWLLPDPADKGEPCPAWKLQRHARAALREAGFPDHQFRDGRRSGMSFFRDKGADLSDIFVISGHMVLGKRTIADTYLPPDTRAACRAVGTVLRTLEAQRVREEQAQ